MMRYTVAVKKVVHVKNMEMCININHVTSKTSLDYIYIGCPPKKCSGLIDYNF